MAKRVSSEAQKEYKKEVRRIERIIKRAEQEGFIFPEDVVPKIPKKITKKALEKIKSVKQSDLYAVAEFVGTKKVKEPEQKKQTVAKITPTKRSRTKKITSQQKATVPRIAKEKPAPLTEEEKKKRRSRAGKKAWETRKAKMSPEEYDAYVKQQVERMQKGKRGKKKEEPYYPTKSAVEEVTHKLVELERNFEELSDEEANQIEAMFSQQYYPTIEYVDQNITTLNRQAGFRSDLEPVIWERSKYKLIAIWESTLQNNKDTMGDLEDYLKDQMDMIDHYLHSIRYDSFMEIWLNSFAALGNILKQGALTAVEAEELSSLSERSSYDQLDEVWYETYVG